MTVTFALHQERRAAFLPLMVENARLSLKREPGCRQFDVCSDGGDKVFLYELYEDPAAFEAHLQSAHFKSFDAAVGEMVANKKVQTWAEVQR